MGLPPDCTSMISLGAVLVEPSLSQIFGARFRPISDEWIPEALAVSGQSRAEVLQFPDAREGMLAFDEWLTRVSKGRSMFISDNNGFDWQFVNYYFHRFLKRNPFGHSSSNLNSLYKGTEKDLRRSFKHLRVTKHTHDPVDDAKGNAEAFLKIAELHKLAIF